MRKTLSIIILVAMVATVSAQSKWSYRLGFGGEIKSGNLNSASGVFINWATGC